MITRASLGDLVMPAWYRVISSEFEIEAKKQVGLSLLNVKETKRKYEEETGVGRFPRFSVKSEGGAIQELDMVQMADVRYEPKTYAGRSLVTYEMMNDDLYNVINGDRPKALVESGLATVEEINALLFENGFSSSYTQATGGFMGGGVDNGDSVSLFNAAHVYANGGTWSNTSATNVDLSVDTLNDALVALRRQKDIAGEHLISSKVKYLLVAPENEKNAKEILNSTLISDSGNNAVNVYNGMGIEIKVWPFLSTYAKAWYLLCDKHFLNFWWREKPKMFNYVLRNQDEEIGAMMRFANGWTMTQGTWGSRGSV